MVEKFDTVERDFSLALLPFSCFIHYPNFVYYFSSQIILLSNSIFIEYFVLTFSIDLDSTFSHGINVNTYTCTCSH